MPKINIFKNFKKDKSGQSVVEFALILPLLFLLIFGMINFGLYMHAKYIVVTAARQAARVGAMTNSNAKIRGMAVQIIQDNLNVPSGDIGKYIDINIVNASESSRSIGDSLTVTVTYLFKLPVVFNFKNLEVPFFAADQGLPISNTITTRIESYDD